MGVDPGPWRIIILRCIQRTGDRVKRVVNESEPARLGNSCQSEWLRGNDTR